MRVLVCGSLAYDSIMVFPDRFAEHILADKIDKLNVAFLVPELRIEYGGCAGNIAWNLKMLGAQPVIMATVGKDFARYKDRLIEKGLDVSCITAIEDAYTAQAFVTTDADDNQIIAFHPGAMNYSDKVHVSQAGEVQLAILGPDGRQGMIDHVHQCHQAGIDCIFDPGQGLPVFSGDELLELTEKASYLTLNDYEAEMFQQRTGKTLQQLAHSVQALVVTYGDKGSHIYSDGEVHEIPVVTAQEVVDPTGCGDAYRAGLIYGISQGFDWPTSGRLASLLGSIKIACQGGQNHSFGSQQIATLFEKNFGYSLPV